MEQLEEPGQNLNKEVKEVTKAELEEQLERGANWFFWIAGLSIVNSLAFLGGAEGSFVIGLGITQLIDAIVMEIGKDADMKAKVCAFAIDVMVACFVVMFGIVARKKRRWAFITGMILYALDGLLFVLAQDILSVGFHAFALFGIYGGLKACKELQANEINDREPENNLPMYDSSLTEESGENVIKKDVVWPTVITILSVVYLIFYVLLSINTISKPLKIGGCCFFLGGIVGMAFKRKHAITLVMIGAGIIIGYTLYSFFNGLNEALKEAPAAGVIFAFLFLSFILFWPVFLIFWFLRRKVREHVSSEWQ